MANYQMRAWHTVNTEYVFWESSGSPDFAGTSSGYTPGDLTAIVVKAVIPGEGSVPNGDAGNTWTTVPMTVIDEVNNQPVVEMSALDSKTGRAASDGLQMVEVP